MAIQITCPGCLKRFKVSEKFAGQKGPCPACKTVIQIPKKGEEVVIHGGEEFDHAGRDTQGKVIGKPILREQTDFDATVAGAVGAGSLVTVIVAAILGYNGVFQDSMLLCTIGLLAISPPLAVGGYKFLSNSEELRPYRGKWLWIRAGICALVYVVLWGIFGYAAENFLTGEIWEWILLVAPILVAGGFVGLICFDFDFASGFLHYSFYVVVTIILRWLVGLDWIWNIPPPAGPM
jgi:hypothetical protein